MIGVDYFKFLVELYKTHEAELDKLCSVFETAFDSKLIDCFWKCHNELLFVYFENEGYELITDFLCENLYDEEGRLIEDVNEIWEIVKKYRK